MRKLRLYLDSSILGWSLNRGNPGRFAEANLLLQQIGDGKFIGAYSWVSAQEINAAPEQIAQRLWQKVEEAKLKRVSVGLKRQAEELRKHTVRFPLSTAGGDHQWKLKRRSFHV